MTQSTERQATDQAGTDKAGDLVVDPDGESTGPSGFDAAHDAVIAEALGVIDQALGQVGGRELVTSGEVADLLLDLRTALTAPPANV